MDRKTFIKSCGALCLGGSVLSLALQSCSGMKTFSGEIAGSDLIVPLYHFEFKKDGKVSYKKNIVVHHDDLLHPIAVFRHSMSEYSAVWMRCTHQGAELQLFGEQLQCPAHGSEFDGHGMVLNGPAENRLRNFPVSIDEQMLKISLK